MSKTELKNLSTQFFKAEELSTANYSFSLIDSLCLQGDNYVILPGFCDVHVHFREPGFSYKETIKSGSQSASRGGYTAVCTMPNLSPVPDSVENIAIQQSIIDRDAVISVFPYGSITVAQKGEELVDFDKTAGYVIAYSDDGKGIQSEEMMLCAMEKAKKKL